MIIPIRIKDKRGYPVYEVVRDQIKEEPSDNVRLCNYSRDIASKFEYAFTCHANATERVRKHLPTKGFAFSELVTKMLVGRPSKEAKELARLKEAVRKVIPLLNDTAYVEELTQLVGKEEDAKQEAAPNFSAS